ncbi:unnamed protein product [[Actinomadura] parvosata subsp. kistnae]|nr:unnamed protein product [Actinomadura parvosata subsp. kistnae]
MHDGPEEDRQAANNQDQCRICHADESTIFTLCCRKCRASNGVAIVFLPTRT